LGRARCVRDHFWAARPEPIGSAVSRLASGEL
jgi:hypothetical protein